MSTSIKPRRAPGARPTSGRNSGRPIKTIEKSHHTDGVYSNKRYVNVITSLIGCNVQIQVKNKDIYDGVLTTVSPEMGIVLKKAHKVSELGSNTIPSRELLEEAIVYNVSDVVAINVSDVDLEYAVRDSFTDGGISKFNGQSGEKELTPWECEGGEDEIVLENETSNGWDPNEMFRTNRDQFNYQSTYDDKLSQYTTVLDKSNENYRKREEAASKLALEIERTDGYRARIDLENGDGDEEDRFSAVVRPRENSPKIGNGTGKYIPPNQRGLLNPHGDGARRASPARTSQGGHHRVGNAHSQMVPHTPNTSVGSPPVPPPQNIQKQLTSQSPVSSTSPTPSAQTPPAKLTEQPQPEKNEVVSETAVNSVSTANSNGGIIENTTNTSQSTSPNSKSSGPQNDPKRREETRDLKEFSHTFKLNEGEAKPGSEEKTTDSERTNEQTEQKESEKDNKDKLAETVKKSTLNPNAKEFVFNPTKSLQPKHSNANTPTPPRPHTQSPIIQPCMTYMLPMAPTHMQGQPMAMPQVKLTKKAVVSVSQRPDFNAAAQAATGQPLLAQTTGSFAVPYPFIHGMPQHTHPTYHQMVPVNHSTRMPPNVSVMSNNGQGQEHNPQYSPLFMAPPVPAHLPHGHPHQPPTPAHMNQHHVAHHPQPQHPVAQMGHQSGGHHPSPSPVQHHGGMGSQQPHPQSSGTPQPHIIYPGSGMGQQNHPPLQASPHNPTSPSALHHLQMPSYTYGPAMQGGPPMSMPQGHPPSSGPHMMHVAHSHMGGGPHTMMIPHPQAHGQMQPHGQIQHGQFPHQMQAHIGGQGHGGHVVQQPGMIPVSQQSASMPYIQHHQVPNQALPQGYPHNQ